MQFADKSHCEKSPKTSTVVAHRSVTLLKRQAEYPLGKEKYFLDVTAGSEDNTAHSELSNMMYYICIIS